MADLFSIFPNALAGGPEPDPDKLAAVAQACVTFMATIDGLIPAGRERALVVTKLQEAGYFALRALYVAAAGRDQ